MDEAARMPKDARCRMIDMVEFVRRVSENKRRQTGASEAGRQAKRAIREREQFVPKSVAPVRPIDGSF